ncbi:oligogalacturonide lyase [Neolewinella xylanilytica]|uniref:Oligogalacturonide lyase n=1 Tax=Neolewinella xylanilytica TaxID=1514080 RepID=A0A2S6IAF6_9BACT|nr:PD40 domain-containing protein [Neolewinella xylanilytica]PPK88484.1 oligogalacturonide lyase [Neolewinella xylanilytica]
MVDPKHLLLFILLLGTAQATAQIGQRFPSEREVVKDPVTGHELIFLTGNGGGDSKIYPTHNQWTSDGKWLIFRSDRVAGEAMAVNEQTGNMVQVTEGGYAGMLTVARQSMQLYVMRAGAQENTDGTMEVVAVDLDRLFTDSEAGDLQDAETYQRVIGVIPESWGAHSDMALDADEKVIYFRTGSEHAAGYLPEGTVLEEDFGPRGMGAGPGGIGQLDIASGELSHVVSVPFQVGHVQTNPWVPGQIVFSWETGGKSPQRTWIVNADGSGLAPLYPEADYEWVTHEAVIGPDEVAFAIMGHREIGGGAADGPGQETEWGPSGTRAKPSGLGILTISTGEMRIAGQTEEGSGLWHVHGSPDGRFAVGDDFSRSLYLIDRATREMMLLSTGHLTTAADHPHPTFSPDGTKIEIQSAMRSDDGRRMSICVIPVPAEWLSR